MCVTLYAMHTTATTCSTSSISTAGEPFRAELCVKQRRVFLNANDNSVTLIYVKNLPPHSAPSSGTGSCDSNKRATVCPCQCYGLAVEITFGRRVLL